jgi:hypothetical protein
VEASTSSDTVRSEDSSEVEMSNLFEKKLLKSLKISKDKVLPEIRLFQKHLSAHPNFSIAKYYLQRKKFF